MAREPKLNRTAKLKEDGSVELTTTPLAVSPVPQIQVWTLEQANAQRAGIVAQRAEMIAARDRELAEIDDIIAALVAAGAKLKAP